MAKKDKFLVVIGGAEDHDDECRILKDFIDLAGGKGAVIAILAVAAEDAVRVEQIYKSVFARLGAGKCFAIHITERSDANDQDTYQQIIDVDGIFFTGGDQLRITTMLGGTKLYNALHIALEQGVIVAGTSAGASAMSEIMIISGDSKKPPAKETVNLSPGLGLVAGMVIDQHFAQRGRIGRLLSVVAYNPQLLGVGIDENTAVVINTTEGLISVIGEGAVTIVDGKDIDFSNVAAVSEEETLAVSGYTLHTLPQGYQYDLKMRRVCDSARGSLNDN